MPVRFTADGAGLSPPLQWSGLPEGTASLALIAEDVDAPFPHHRWSTCCCTACRRRLNGLAEAAVPKEMGPSRMFAAGRNSFGRRGWLPPSPIPGHGPHRYVFQILALSAPFAPRRVAGRGALRLMARRTLLGHGRLVGIYERALSHLGMPGSPPPPSATPMRAVSTASTGRVSHGSYMVRSTTSCQRGSTRPSMSAARSSTRRRCSAGSEQTTSTSSSAAPARSAAAAAKPAA